MIKQNSIPAASNVNALLFILLGAIAAMTPLAIDMYLPAMPNIAKDWAQKLDAQGAPGTAMLKAYTAKLKAAGETPVRDWAAE